MKTAPRFAALAAFTVLGICCPVAVVVLYLLFSYGLIAYLATTDDGTFLGETYPFDYVAVLTAPFWTWMIVSQFFDTSATMNCRPKE